MKHALAALVVLSASACLSLDEPEVELDAVERSDPGESGCSSWGCGANSATVGDGLIFDELDRLGNYPNTGGLRIISTTTPDNHPGFLYVYRDQLRVGRLDGSRWYVGQEVVNTVFTLNHPLKGNYEVKITALDEQSLRYWAGRNDVVPFYELKTRRAVKGAKFDEYACRDPLTADPHWTANPHAAIIFTGDRYDAKYKKARDVGDWDSWFNVACAATAPAKMHLIRHTRASGTDSYGTSYPTSDTDRTAMLKMFTADYCGTGHTFTVDGRPLSYEDSNHWMPPASGWSVESEWTWAGATCLNYPRWIDDMNMIYGECQRVLPACANTPDWDTRAHVLSKLTEWP